jgi:hypothetical protein
VATKVGKLFGANHLLSGNVKAPSKSNSPVFKKFEVMHIHSASIDTLCGKIILQKFILK